MNMEKLKELREKSGAGLQDCRKAMQKYDGDIEKALQDLLEQGLIAAASRENRETNEGLVFTRQESARAALVHLACETDFAANSNPFRDSGEALLDLCMSSASAKQAQQQCGPVVDELRLKLREKLELKGLKICTAAKNEKLFMYKHHTGKAGSIIRYAHSGADDSGLQECILDLALQAVSLRPLYIEESEISLEGREQILAECNEAFSELGKPEPLREKIVGGMVEKQLNRIVLMRQRFIKDETIKVKDYLEDYNRKSGQQLRVLETAALAVCE